MLANKIKITCESAWIREHACETQHDCAFGRRFANRSFLYRYNFVDEKNIKSSQGERNILT